MSQPHIFELDIWRDHEERVIETILFGLSLLRSDDGVERLKNELSLPDTRKPEDKISTVLNWYLIKATRQLWQKTDDNGKRRGPSNIPKPQNPKAPNPHDRSIASVNRERKKPDFKWGFVDHACKDEFKGDRDFDIECKRLGKSTKPSLYVQDGIRRFITDEHRYGEDESSGAMIGYIENMEFDDILQEVNAEIAITLRSVPQLSKPLDGWKEQATSRLEHEFKRPFPISPFHLWHFWIDLRGCYSNNLPVKNQKRTTKKKSL